MTRVAQHTKHRVIEDRAASRSSGAAPGGGRGPGPLALALIGLLTIASTHVAAAKSVYVIGEVVGTDVMDADGNPVLEENGDVKQEGPILAYDVGPDGKLAFQAKGIVPYYGAGAVGLALDSISQHLFLTYESSSIITILDATTLKPRGTAKPQGARNLAGIVFDNDKGLLYAVARGTGGLYVFQWQPASHELIPAPDVAVPLEGAQAYGIALDEIHDELYVGNFDVTSFATSVTVYRTSDWSFVRKIPVQKTAISVAVDPVRSFLYYGAGYAHSFYLSQYDLLDNTEKAVLTSPTGGVMGLGVDAATGLVFLSTGDNGGLGAKDLLVYDGHLVLVDAARDIGFPTGLVVPDGHTSYNPLRLTKTIKTSIGDATTSTGLPQVTIGEEFTYAVTFDHNDLLLTDVSIVDALPAEISFVHATGNGTYGAYDPDKHTYTWNNPPLAGGPQKSLELVCRVGPLIPPGRVITNSVTIRTRETPATTTEVEVVTVPARVYKPLHVTKKVIAGATGGNETTLPSAYAGDEVTYRITFDNNDNPYPVAHVSLTDTLPPEATFVRATGDVLFGRHDETTHSYTWSYSELASRASQSVDLVVRLKNTVAGGTTVINTATVASDNTSATRTSVSIAVASFAPLGLEKTISLGAVGHPDGKGRPYVETGTTVTYAICLSNPATNRTVTQVVLVDTLPPEVTFVSADGDRDFGSYDPGTDVRAPTYTWRYASLAPGTQRCVHLVVQVNDKLDPNSVISNAVTAGAAQTAQTKAQLDAVVRVAAPKPLVLQKTLVGGAVGKPDSKGQSHVDRGSTITYALCFSNPATNRTMTQITLVDTLPREVTFVSADGDREFGSYDDKTRTYTWRYDALEPGAQKCVNLVVRVADKLDPNTVIRNSATISPGQGTTTATTTAQVNVVVRPPATDVQGVMYVKPDHLYRNNSPAKANLMIVVHLPEGIGMAALSNTPLVLTPGNVQATGQMPFGDDKQGKVLGFFDVAPILAATKGTPQEYGECPIRVTGRLADGRTFFAEGKIWILKFGGP